MCGAYLESRTWIYDYAVGSNTVALRHSAVHERQVIIVFPALLLSSLIRFVHSEQIVPALLRSMISSSGLRLEYLACSVICAALAERMTDAKRTMSAVFPFLANTFVANETPVEPDKLYCLPKFVFVFLKTPKTELKQRSGKACNSILTASWWRSNSGAVKLSDSMDEHLQMRADSLPRPSAVQNICLARDWVAAIHRLNMVRLCCLLGPFLRFS